VSKFVTRNLSGLHIFSFDRSIEHIFPAGGNTFVNSRNQRSLRLRAWDANLRTRTSVKRSWKYLERNLGRNLRRNLGRNLGGNFVRNLGRTLWGKTPACFDANDFVSHLSSWKTKVVP
jgi:hypothetical protein